MIKLTKKQRNRIYRKTYNRVGRKGGLIVFSLCEYTPGKYFNHDQPLSAMFPEFNLFGDSVWYSDDYRLTALGFMIAITNPK